MVFLCENNQYGMSMPLHRGMNAASIADRALGYGIPGQQVDGMDALAVYSKQCSPLPPMPARGTARC